jgi:myo-inositol catabolism protein IolS
MLYANLGQTNIQFSKIILGTWQADKSMWPDSNETDISKAIQKAIELGISTIDTAMEYGNGYSEQIIGKTLKNTHRRQYQLATKVFSDKLKYDFVIRECHQSLKNLQTDYIDLYQIHWPSGSFQTESVPIEETMRALNQLQKEGKILHIGVSNFSSKQIEEARQYGEIVSNQPPYSLLWRHYDTVTNPYCRQNNLSILAYSALAQGILTGKFDRNYIFKPKDHRTANKLLHPDIYSSVEKVLEGLKKYAEKYQVTIGNIAIRWLISQPNSFAIVGARNAAQVEDNARSCEFTMTATELEEIDLLSQLVTKNMSQNEMMWHW